MAKGHPIVANLQAVTLNWASPIEVDPVKNADRKVEVLLQSSAGSWVQQDYNIQPDFTICIPNMVSPILGRHAPTPWLLPYRVCSRVTSRVNPIPWKHTGEETGEGPQPQPQACLALLNHHLRLPGWSSSAVWSLWMTLSWNFQPVWAQNVILITCAGAKCCGVVGGGSGLAEYQRAWHRSQDFH